MIATLKLLGEMLSEEAVSAPAVAAALGNVLHHGGLGVPLTVQPTDASLREARVARAGDTEQVAFVEVIPAQPVPLRELVAAFGPFQKVPRLPDPRQLPRVRFDIELPGRAHTAALFASCATDGEVTDADPVAAVLIRRD